ncbi:RNA-binding protein [Shimia ponticola]|uniref:RNA-binding protein n=1 Tax=Shimia ponticola TaxID=2582893 RepID=UPI0011BF6093|nr:RNA-binding protein [Shimia ponticola]
MTRGGAQKQADGPERMCLVTRDSGPKDGLIRFVTGPDGQVVPDLLGKLPGRGYYVSARRSVLEEAVKKRVFARGAKGPVTVPEGLVDEIDRQLARRVTDLIAMARKAGLAIAGFEKVKAALTNDRVKVLLQASDGSARGKGKLWTPEGARWFGCLTADELGLAFGRSHVIHGALLAGGLTTRVVEEAAKLRGLREEYAQNGASGAGKDT